MKSFVARRNIERYERLLETAADETSRRVLLGLLTEEKARLAELILQESTPRSGQTSCEGPSRKQ